MWTFLDRGRRIGLAKAAWFRIVSFVYCEPDNDSKAASCQAIKRCVTLISYRGGCHLAFLQASEEWDQLKDKTATVAV